MQIEVRDGSRILWVEEFACFLDNGELAFSYHELPEIIPPDWYGAPESSNLREEHKSNDPEHPDEELCSMAGSAGEVLEFYRERVLRGGLLVADTPVVDHDLKATDLSRLEPGFFAESLNYRLSLDIYEHRGTTFWRVKHGPKLPPGFRSKKEPKFLIFVNEADGKVILQNPATSDTLWAPSSVLTDEPPQYPKRKSPEPVPISWAILPAWLQFEITPETAVTARSSFRGGALAGFSCMNLAGNIRMQLEEQLDRLDTFGFDASAKLYPDHGYYLQPMTGGRHVKVCIIEKSGDRVFLTFVDTRSGPMLYAHYQTQRALEEFLSGPQ